MTKVSCVVPIYNALDDVKILLKSILDNFNFDLGEVILINDCSSKPETSEFLKEYTQQHPQLKYYENEQNLGFVKTCNRGMQLANNEIIVLLNSDTIIPKEFCERIIKCFNSDEKIGIASPISAHSPAYFIPLPKGMTVEEMNQKLRSKHKCSYPVIPNAEGFCFCIRKEVIEKQGYLDTVWGKGYHEEVDFAYRAITNGWKNVLIDDLYVFHKAEASFGKKNRKQQIQRNNEEFKKRWGGFRDKYSLENNLENPMLQIDKELHVLFQDRELLRTPAQYIFSIKKTKTKMEKVLTILGLQFKLKKNLNKRFRFLVHLHLYYHEQLDFMIEKLKNIQGCDWDLYVTINENNEESSKKILEFKPDAKIIQVENLGFDVLPFIKVIRSVNIENYDYVLKIHTKNTRKNCNIQDFRYNGKHLKDTFWRDELLSALINTKKRFSKNIGILSQDSNIGMIINKTFFMNLRDYIPEETYLLDELKTRLNINSSYNKFLAGTMFIIKADILNKVINSDLNDNDFVIDKEIYNTGSKGTTAHVIERIFTLLTDEMGYKIYAIPNLNMEIYGFGRSLIKNIFSLKNSGDKSHKIITILGFKLKIKKK